MNRPDNDEPSYATDITMWFSYSHSETELILFLTVDSLFSDDHTRSSHVVMLLLINGGALKFESFEADDIRQTLHFIMRGLRQRSTHAIATPSTDGKYNCMWVRLNNES